MLLMIKVLMITRLVRKNLTHKCQIKKALTKIRAVQKIARKTNKLETKKHNKRVMINLVALMMRVVMVAKVTMTRNMIKINTIKMRTFNSNMMK